MNSQIMKLGMCISTLLVVAWCFLWLKYRKQYTGLLDSVDGKIFTLKDIYFIGLGAIEIYETVRGKKITESDKALVSISRLSEIFGREYGEMYYYVSVSATISLALTFVPIGLMLGALMGSWLGYLCGLALAFVLTYGVNSSINASVEKKKDAIVGEFPQMVSKLTMLINAGMLVRRAWDEVANSNFEEPLYQEMRITSKDIQEGMSVELAMQNFATRCAVKEIRKFSSIYVQAVNRGASESVDSMKAMADEAWVQKKNIAKQKGEVASQKLLVPNMIMFMGILIVVVVPMMISTFGNINM